MLAHIALRPSSFSVCLAVLGMTFVAWSCRSRLSFSSAWSRTSFIAESSSCTACSSRASCLRSEPMFDFVCVRSSACRCSACTLAEMQFLSTTSLTHHAHHGRCHALYNHLWRAFSRRTFSCACSDLSFSSSALSSSSFALFSLPREPESDVVCACSTEYTHAYTRCSRPVAV